MVNRPSRIFENLPSTCILRHLRNDHGNDTAAGFSVAGYTSQGSHWDQTCSKFGITAAGYQKDTRRGGGGILLQDRPISSICISEGGDDELAGRKDHVLSGLLAEHVVS